MKQKNNNTILALYPNARGLGYALFSNPKEIIDFGISYVQPVNNKKVRHLIKKYICLNINLKSNDFYIIYDKFIKISRYFGKIYKKSFIFYIIL